VISVVCLPSEDFLFDELPVEDHDQRVDAIIF
jgi:5-formyltetrahydrofolate cyclo-ligase